MKFTEGAFRDWDMNARKSFDRFFRRVMGERRMKISKG